MSTPSETLSSDSVLPLPAPQKTFVFVLAAISFCHLLNDMVQSLIVAIYPNLQKTLHLDLAQFGLISSYVSSHGVAAATFCGYLYGQTSAAFLAIGRDGVFTGGDDRFVAGRKL